MSAPHLETCWHISPPWRDRVPPLRFQIKHRVYMPKQKLSGWVCGAMWNAAEYDWTYSINTRNGCYRKQEHELVSCNRLQIVQIPAQKVELGEKALLRGLGRRIIQGILLNDNRWLYAVERIPTLDHQEGSHFAWYSDEGILKLEALL